MKKFMFAAIAAMVMVSVSNVFASSRMVGNAEVTPVDTVAPETPADTLATGTSIQPQAGVEDSTQQENATEATTECYRAADNCRVKDKEQFILQRYSYNRI